MPAFSDTAGQRRPVGTPAAPEVVRLGNLDVRLREFQSGDEAEIAGVYRSAFGVFYPAEKPVDEEAYLRWFVEPHRSHRGRITVAEVGGRVVNVCAELTRDIKIGSRTLYGNAGGIATGTHPDFSGRGVNGARARWRLGTANPPVTASVDTRTPGARSSRDSPVPSSGEMGVYLFVLRPWSLARIRGGGGALVGLPAAVAAAAWARLRSRVRSGAARDVTVRTVPEFQARFDTFLDRASADWDIIPIRSREYLTWRFCDRRAGAFTVRAAEAGGEIVGYSVLHTLGTRGHLVDLLALPGRLDVVRTLIDDAVAAFRREGLAAVECWMLREQPYARVLRQAGFALQPGRSAEIAGEVGWYGSGIGRDELELLTSPETRTHLVRADFDAI